jgi:ectoine hydroxylase-related dioxygenase (phytanoyl-CoA dioxygenase family)
MSIDEAQKTQFEQKGFLILRNHYSAAIMARVSDWLTEMQERPRGDKTEARYYERNINNDDNVLVRIENVFNSRNKQFRELLLDQHTIEILANLFGEAPVLFKEKANLKPPGCRADKLHQDQAAGWSRFANFFISMAIAVDANREDNAPMSILASGNYERKLMTEEWQPLSESDPPFEPYDEYMLLEADPGDVVFFDSYLPHGSPPNTGVHPRRNLYLTFNRESEGDLRKSYYEHKWSTYPPNEPDQARENASHRV